MSALTAKQIEKHTFAAVPLAVKRTVFEPENCSPEFDYFFTFWIGEDYADRAYEEFLYAEDDAGKKVDLNETIDSVLRTHRMVEFFDWVTSDPYWSNQFNHDRNSFELRGRSC